jgi:hypothetical protein
LSLLECVSRLAAKDRVAKRLCFAVCAMQRLQNGPAIFSHDTPAQFRP